MYQSKIRQNSDYTVLFQNRNYSIESYLNTNTGNKSMVIVVEGCSVSYIDYVVIYSPGDIAFDWPERLPQYIRDKARELSLTLNQ